MTEDEFDEGAMSNGDDVAFAPGPGADSFSEIESCIDPKIRELYDVYSYRHASSILKHSHATEFNDVCQALLKFRLSTAEIKAPGGNETTIAKRVTSLLRPTGWFETRISADLKVTKKTKRQSVAGAKPQIENSSVDIPNFVDGHKVDFVKNRVAFDLEWNSKDQTFDRDLYAFRAFYDCSLISAGILLTRSQNLNPVFASMGDAVKKKYGASTTWMGKLLYRLNAGRNGGCPVLVFGITSKLISDWTD